MAINRNPSQGRWDFYVAELTGSWVYDGMGPNSYCGGEQGRG